MESFIVLGCILDKSSRTLRLTSDPKERIGLAIVSAIFSLVCLLPILFSPFSRVGWSGLIVFGGVSAACLFVAFFSWQCRTEIEFDVSQGQVVRRRFCGGRVWSVSVLPLSQLKAIRAVEGNEEIGVLQLIRTDGKVWARWVFLIEPLAKETRREILAWLRECSAYAALEEVAAGPQE